MIDTLTCRVGFPRLTTVCLVTVPLLVSWISGCLSSLVSIHLSPSVPSCVRLFGCLSSLSLSKSRLPPWNGKQSLKVTSVYFNWGYGLTQKGVPLLTRWSVFWLSGTAWSSPRSRSEKIQVLGALNMDNLSLSVPSTVYTLLVSCSLDVSLHLSSIYCLPVCLVVSGSLDVLSLSL